MNRLRCLILVLALCLPVATLAAADRAFDFYASNLLILEAKPAQKAIGVTEAQRKKMNQFADADRPKRTAILQQFQREADAAQKTGRTYQPDESKMRPLDEALKRDVMGVLTDAQLKRLREITIQSSGIVALLDTRVAQEAGVPSGTVKKLRDTFTSGAKQAEAVTAKVQQRLYDEYKLKKPKNEAEARKLQEEALGRLRKETAPQIKRIQQQTKAKMEGMLSPAQRTAFKKLQGVPFNP